MKVHCSLLAWHSLGFRALNAFGLVQGIEINNKFGVKIEPHVFNLSKDTND